MQGVLVHVMCRHYEALAMATADYNIAAEDYLPQRSPPQGSQPPAVSSETQLPLQSALPDSSQSPAVGSETKQSLQSAALAPVQLANWHCSEVTNHRCALPSRKSGLIEHSGSLHSHSHFLHLRMA